MKWNSTMFFSILFTLTSCNGQISPPGALPAAPAQASVHVRPDTVQALSPNIMVVYQDQKNRYWFGSWQDGLYQFDGTHLLHYTTEQGLSHNRVEEIKEDPAGNLYFNTRGGVDRFDGRQFTKLQVGQVENNWKLFPGDIWFRCIDSRGQAYRFDGFFLHRLSLPKNEKAEAWRAAHPHYGVNPYDVFSLYKDSKGNIWFGGGIFGLCRYNGSSFDWITETDVTEYHDGPSNGVRGMVEDREGLFWFNTMFRYDVYGNCADGAAFPCRRIPGIGSLDGRTDSDMNEFLSITRDDANNIWIAAFEGGAFRWDGNEITRFAVQSEGADIHVFSIYKDRLGKLWLGTPEHGAYLFNGSSFEKFSKN